MGMRGPVSRSSYDFVDYRPTGNSGHGKIEKLPNPDPNNYKILRSLSGVNWLLLEVQYPDCTNYEGKKILLFRNTTLEKIKAQKTLDPHFSNNKNYISPFARFEPTKEGWKIAVQFMDRFV